MLPYNDENSVVGLAERAVVADDRARCAHICFGFGHKLLCVDGGICYRHRALARGGFQQVELFELDYM